MIVRTLVKACDIHHGVKASSLQPKGTDVCGWLPEKDHPLYLDMLVTLRCVPWKDRLNTKSILHGGLTKILNSLRFTLCAAA